MQCTLVSCCIVCCAEAVLWCALLSSRCTHVHSEYSIILQHKSIKWTLWNYSIKSLQTNRKSFRLDFEAPKHQFCSLIHKSRAYWRWDDVPFLFAALKFFRIAFESRRHIHVKYKSLQFNGMQMNHVRSRQCAAWHLLLNDIAIF